MPQPHVQSCGAAQGLSGREFSLLDADYGENVDQQPQTRNAASWASGPAPSTAELNMIMKSLQTFVPEFPKLEPGDPASRARRLQQWLLQVSQSLEPAGHHVTAWWSWARTTAEDAHRIFLTKSVEQRESVQPQSGVPPRHTVVESWMRPRILASLPKNQRDWVDLRAQAGEVDSSSCLIFYPFKVFAPGSPNDKRRSPEESFEPQRLHQPSGSSD